MIVWLMAAGLAGPALADDDLGTPTFPVSMQRDVVSRWIAGSTNLPRNAALVFGPDGVVAILSNETKPGENGIRKVSFREEATQANYVTRMGGRSIAGVTDIDCRARAVKLASLTIYAGSNLQGREISHMGQRTDWRVPTPDRVLSRVVNGACGAGRPTVVAAAADTSRPAAGGLKPAIEAPPALRPSLSPSVRPEPAPKPAAKAAPVAAPKPDAPKREASKPSNARGDNGAEGGVLVQVGAVGSQAAGGQEWDRIARQNAEAFKGRSRQIAKASVNGATVYRVLVGGFSSRTEAESFCRTLQAAGRACFIRR